MVINNVYGDNFIFIPIPKTASTSVIKCLGRSNLVPNLDDPWVYYTHSHLQCIPKSERHEFLFSFVRNPFARLLSCYHYTTKNVFDFETVTFHIKLNLSFSDWFDIVTDSCDDIPLSYEIPHNHMKMSTQKWYEENIDSLIRNTIYYYKKFSSPTQLSYFRCEDWHNPNEIHVDFIGRYENLKEDWKYIAKIIGADLELTNEKKSDRLCYKKYYTPELREKVFNWFKEDFDYFGYDW